MIKRPLCPMLAAYVAGIYLAWQQMSFIVAVIFSVIAYFLIYLLMFGTRKKFVNKQDWFVWLLPLLICAGYFAMLDRVKKPDLYDSFEQEINCELNGKIIKITENTYGLSLYLKDNLITANDGKQYLCNKLIVKEKNRFFSSGSDERSARSYKIGNKIHVTGTLHKFSSARNPGEFNEQLYYQIDDIYFFLEAEQITITNHDYSIYHSILGAVRKKLSRVFDLILSDREAGTLTAMLLGDRSSLDDEVKKLYQENGISHILAISGLHISLIGMFFYKFLKKIKCPIPLAGILTIFFIYSYGVLTDFSVSTNRAIIMTVISLMAPITGRTYDMISAICLSALVILLQNPMQVLSAGFLLSYGAVFGIAVIYPALRLLITDGNVMKNSNKPDKADSVKKAGSAEESKEEIKESNIKENSITVNKYKGDKDVKKIRPAIKDKLAKSSLVNSVLISISTQLSTVPIILYFFYQIPVYSIIINLIILPLISVLILLAVMGVIAGLIYMPAGVFIIGGANYILKLYEFICRLGSALPGNMLTAGKPDKLSIIIYFLFLCVSLILLYRNKRRAGLLLMVSALLFLVFPHRNKDFEVTFLDVGQGDAIYMESVNKSTYLIDGGSSDVSKVGIYRIRPFLLSKGRDVIDYAIITHSDRDHTSGLTELINDGRIKIKNLLMPDIAAKDDNYMQLEKLAHKNNIAVKYISAGDSIRDGDMLISCLHPAEGYNPPDSNAYSTVLSVQYNDFSMLLTGDAEADGEAMVIEQLYRSKYSGADNSNHFHEFDVLKVAHHGSRSATSEEFLSYVRPKLAVISCGLDNSYGHPHKELLDRLDEVGSKKLITYNTGAITFMTDGVILKYKMFLEN